MLSNGLSMTGVGKHRSALHASLMRFVIQDGVVEYAAVVPEHHVTDRPAVAKAELHVLAMCMQVSKHRLAFGAGEAFNVGGVGRAEVQRLAS